MSGWHLLADASVCKWCHIRSQLEHSRVSQRKKIHKGIRLRLPTISAPDVLVRVISARMFHHRNILAHTAFGAADISANGCSNIETFWHGSFLHGEFSAREIFGTGTFWHRDILASWTFCYIPSHARFQHGEFSAWRHFSTSIFGTWILMARIFLHSDYIFWFHWHI